MKYLAALAFSLFVIACCCSCKKYEGDSYDFSEKTPHYMRFASKVPLEDTEGNDFGFTLQTRVGFTEDLTVNYSIKLDGLPEENYTVIYPKNTVSKTYAVDFPVGTVPAGDDMIEGIITLKSASGPRTGQLAIGYPKTGNEVIPVTIIKR